MRVDGSAGSMTPRSSLPAYTFDVEAGKVEDEQVVEAPIDPANENFHSKNTQVLFFDLQQCSRKKTRLTISQDDEIANPLRVVLHKPEDELMRFLESVSYHYGANCLTVADPVSERFGAVKADDTLEQWESSLCLKKNLRSLLSTVVIVDLVVKSLPTLVSR